MAEQNVPRQVLSRALDHVPYGPRRLIYRTTNPTAFATLLRARTPKGQPWGNVSRYLSRRCIWVHIPKTAGMTLSSTLFDGRHGWHTTMRHYSLIFTPREFRSFFKFTIIRNPWDRLFSAWTFVQAGGMPERTVHLGERTPATLYRDTYLSPYPSFEAFVNEGLERLWAEGNLGLWFLPHVYFLKVGSRMPVDFVGRFETLERDIRHIGAQVGVDVSEVPHLNSTKRPRDYRTLYTPAMIDSVARVYAEDIETFGYDFDGTPGAG